MRKFPSGPSIGVAKSLDEALQAAPQGGMVTQSKKMPMNWHIVLWVASWRVPLVRVQLVARE